jgi:hypothetical protein
MIRFTPSLLFSPVKGETGRGQRISPSRRDRKMTNSFPVKGETGGETSLEWATAQEE